MGEWLKECELSLRWVSWSGRSAHIRTPQPPPYRRRSLPLQTRGCVMAQLNVSVSENPPKDNFTDSLLF